ncbi:hypothetical protein BH09GEM1_BH09GEM1_04810 [soil metagenome]
MLRTALLVIAVYLGVMVLPLARAAPQAGAWQPLAMHCGAFLLVGLAAAGALGPVLTACVALTIVPFMYIELRWLIPAVGHAHADASITQWEALLFPGNPSRTLATLWPWLPLSELLHAAYLSYYLLIYLPLFLHWARGRHREFSATILALSVVYVACFTVYACCPVDGPRFLYGAANAPDGPMRAFALSLLAAGSSRGSAFPSSHVAASVVAAACALRFHRASGIVISVCTVLLSVGAVYGGFHYAVDITAGLFTGGLSLLVARLLEKKASRAALTPARSQ